MPSPRGLRHISHCTALGSWFKKVQTPQAHPLLALLLPFVAFCLSGEGGVPTTFDDAGDLDNDGDLETEVLRPPRGDLLGVLGLLVDLEKELFDSESDVVVVGRSKWSDGAWTGWC